MDNNNLKSINEVEKIILSYDSYLHLTVEEEALGESANYEVWAEIALSKREDIEKIWEKLTAEQKELVTRLDNFLREHRKIFENNPVLLSYAVHREYPETHWWWYLPITE